MGEFQLAVNVTGLKKSINFVDKEVIYNVNDIDFNDIINHSHINVQHLLTNAVFTAN